MSNTGSHYDVLVCELTALWDQFPRLNREGLINLAKTEEHALATATDFFIGQVCNGGFNQWISNGYAQAMSDKVVATFKRMNTTLSKQALTLVINARRLTGGFDLHETDGCIEELDVFDTEFYKFCEELETEVENYFQQFAPHEIEYNI